MHDEIAHMRIVHGLLGLRLPGRQRARIIGEDSDDIEIVEVTELQVRERRQLAAKDEMKKLLGFVNCFTRWFTKEPADMRWPRC